MVRACPVLPPEMNWILVIRGRRSRSRTNLLYIRRPLNGKRVCPPHCLKELAIGSLGEAVGNTSGVGQAHFYWIRRRSLGLFGAWVLQTVAAGAHIPKISTDKIALK